MMPASPTATQPEPVTRPEDVPLHEDVRWLAETLGRVIDRLEGPDAFGAVEGLRQACRDRRRGHPDAATFATILERVAALPVDLSAVTARAFTLFFLCMIGQLVWVLKVMPETRGVPLEEMERELGIELSEDDISGAQSGPRGH